MQPQANQQKQATNKKAYAFAGFLLVYQIVVCFIMAFVYGFQGDAFKAFPDYGGMLLVGGVTILLIVGFGLINAYVANSAISSLIITLLIYCMTIQHFYFFRAFWNDAGTNDQFDSTKRFDERYDKVTMSNFLVDRQQSIELGSAAWVEGIACAIALNVAINPVIGRIGYFQVFFLTLFGTFFYQVNSQLMWRWFVTDNSYGYRIFIFGAVVGIVSSLLLGRKQTTIQHPNYKSRYENIALGLLGFLILWCSFPLLSVIGVYTQTTNDNLILYAAPLSMWLALIAGVLGSFTAAAAYYRKFSAHDLIFTGLTGGIIFSSSADVSWNPVSPLIVGFIIGFMCSIMSSTLHRKIIKNGVGFTYVHFSRFLFPGLVAAILAAILQGTGTNKNGSYNDNYFVDQQNREDRSFIGQGAFQIFGILITAVIAALAGVIIGICYKILNKNEEQDQYNDEILIADVPKKYA